MPDCDEICEPNESFPTYISAEAIKGIDIPGLVSGFFNSQKANKDPYSFLNSKAAREASDW